MDLNQKIEKALSEFSAQREALRSSMNALIDEYAHHDYYDNAGFTLSNIISGIEDRNLSQELRELRASMLRDALAFESCIERENEQRKNQNDKINEEIYELCSKFYQHAKELFAQMPAPVLKENCAIIITCKHFDEAYEKALFESFKELGMPYEKRGNSYYGYYFSRKNCYDGKDANVNFQNYELLSQKLDILVEIKTQGHVSQCSRFMVNQKVSSYIWRYETEAQAKLAEIIKDGESLLASASIPQMT